MAENGHMNMQTKRNQGDADLHVDRPLPAGPNITVHLSPIEIPKVSAFAELPSGLTAIVDIPALTAAQLPDGSTLTITILSSDEIASPALPAQPCPTILAGTTNVLATKVVTGAGGVGAPAQSLRVELLRLDKRYVGATIASSASAGIQSPAPWAIFRVVA
jgi:hypothetical protein